MTKFTFRVSESVTLSGLFSMSLRSKLEEAGYITYLFGGNAIEVYRDIEIDLDAFECVDEAEGNLRTVFCRGVVQILASYGIEPMVSQGIDITHQPTQRSLWRVWDDYQN